MSFVISFVLACATILATFMLQLCDDGLDNGASVVGVVSLFAILSALYLVDYLKKFSLSKGVCNILILLAVAVQIGSLAHSRQELLAFAIANILASLQAILFFQSKTLRKCYQILFISFVEVAVGCVFQRSSYFVAALPVYSILAFLCFSLLFLWGERKYYTERVELKVRFTGNGNLKRITAEEPIHQPEYKPLDAFDSAAALVYGKHAKLEDASRFFRRPSIPPIYFSAGYFRRFIFSASTAFVFAALFFCLFPRLREFGFGPLSFDNIHWGGGGGGAQVKTGFRPKIELGDLGPSLDSHETVMTVRFLNCYDKNDAAPLDWQSLVYFRGTALPNYKDHSWSELRSSQISETFGELRENVKRSTLADPDFILAPLMTVQSNRNYQGAATFDANGYSALAQDSPTLLYQLAPRQTSSMNPWLQAQNAQPSDLAPFKPQDAPNTPSVQLKLVTATREMLRAPAADNLVRAIPEQFQLRGFRDYENAAAIADLVAEKKIDLDRIVYDTRNGAIVYEVAQRPLDTRIVFMPSSDYILKCHPAVMQTTSNSIHLYEDRERGQNNGGEFWHLSTAIREKRQTSLTPNQEIVWPYLNQYLHIDKDLFPKLIETAKAWDQESGIPKENFVARARYIESRLRDTGEYKYNRTGVLRNPDLDPLEDFIAEHKAGHCEYFAGALAMLLRAVGIPSRVVVGFAAYPNDSGKPTTVRQSDAHSWVEAFIPGDKLPKRGDRDADLFPGAAVDANGRSCLPDSKIAWVEDGMWLRLDATPSADRDSDRPDALTLGIYTWSNFIRSFGLNFVLNFNSTQQMRNVYLPLLNLWNRCVEFFRSIQSGLEFVRIMADQFKETFKAVFTGKWTPAVVMRLFVILAVFGGFGWTLTRVTRFVKRRLAALREAAEQDAKKARRNTPAALLYFKMEKHFESRLNTTRLPGETPREFVERCFALEDKLVDESRKDDAQNASGRPGETFAATAEAVRQRCKELVETYYRVQFGGGDLAPDENERWQAFLKDAQMS